MLSRTLEEHRAAVSRSLQPIEPLSVLVSDAAGATLVEDVVAGSDLPPSPVAACDGYAVRAEDLLGAPTALPVAHAVSFTDRGPRHHLRGTAARVASGMALPAGADAVVPLAFTDRGDARVTVTRAVTPGSWVRPRGADARADQVLVPAGRRLGGREVALLASLRQARVHVRPVPRVVVIATGSELVDAVSGRPGVPESTAHLITVAARTAGAQAYRVGPIKDDRASLRTAIEDQLVRADLIVLTGGLSDGPEDTVRDVLASLGVVDDVALAFHPGPHHAFALLGEDGGRQVPAIALPGAPVPAALGFEAYVRPAIRSMCGFSEVLRPSVRARVDRAWRSPAGVTQAVPVRLGVAEDGAVTAAVVGEPGAIALAALGAADGIAWVEPGLTEVAAGAVLRCTVWDD